MTRNLKQALFSALLVWAVAYPVLGLKLTIVGINLEVHGTSTDLGHHRRVLGADVPAGAVRPADQLGLEILAEHAGDAGQGQNVPDPADHSALDHHCADHRWR